ncbi:hypothetical protein [Jannaschia donghaensis]|uniref:Uncharacterized protein n=1 Tax=Jannaschia donghaensis TaxID=420998 RepID=A0A0M6YGC8_9RHOB|nr:hypothetical protein [Jannaschia donghaensis]CTQ48543.1 hypothetical protein JDO7802_00545 [Jannaschia donghaensis]
MRFALTIFLSCVLLLTAGPSASHAFAHDSIHASTDMSQMVHDGGTTAAAECCDTTSGRTLSGCGADVVLSDLAFGIAPSASTLRHATLPAQFPHEAVPDTPLGPPKV